jgi:carboxylesterase type B
MRPACYQIQNLFNCMFVQPPEPADPWNGTLDATKFGEKCAALMNSNQEEEIKEWKSLLTAEGTENCLTLNVYTPQVKCKVEPLFRVQC